MNKLLLLVHIVVFTGYQPLLEQVSNMRQHRNKLNIVFSFDRKRSIRKYLNPCYHK